MQIVYNLHEVSTPVFRGKQNNKKKKKKQTAELVFREGEG